MSIIQHIQSEEYLKLLGNPTRLDILRLLLSQPATISQLGEILGKHPAQIRNHLKQLEKASLVKLDYIHTTKNFLEKYYRATAQAYFINLAVFPKPPSRGQMVILGGDDPALDLLTTYINQNNSVPYLHYLRSKSLDSLIYLRENYCQISGCNLFDMEKGEYNIPFIRLLFTDQPMVIITLAHRQQGLLVPRGNPLHISGVTDLEREKMRIINPQRGTGTRLWLDQYLQNIGVDTAHIKGFKFENEISTYSAIASAIANGTADIGLGIYPSAQQFGLDFIPLYEDRYDLVMSQETFQSECVSYILDYIQSGDFCKKIEQLGGCNTEHTGEVIRV